MRQTFRFCLVYAIAWLPFVASYLILLVILVSGRMSYAHTVGSDYEPKPIPLAAGKNPIILDHLAYDRSTNRLWAPASNTAAVDVTDCNSNAIFRVSGFSTRDIELEGRKARMGSNAVSIGEGAVYIGNRGESSLCVIDSNSRVQRVRSDSPIIPQTRIPVRTEWFM